MQEELGLNKGEKVEVCRVAFRPPPFSRANPELWFIQVESHFQVSGISSDNTKYHYIVSALDSDILSAVSDIIRNPPLDDKYKTIKDRLIKHFADSETARLKMLLRDVELGDRRPTHLLRSMQDLAGVSISTDVLRSLFLQRLPTPVQQILSVFLDETDTDLVKLAERADKIVEVQQNSSIVAMVSSNDRDDNRLHNLEQQIQKLTEKVNQLTCMQNMSRTRYENRPRSKSRERLSPPKQKFEICWYHKTFGVKAHKCISPCKFNSASEN